MVGVEQIRSAMGVSEPYSLEVTDSSQEINVQAEGLLTDQPFSVDDNPQEILEDQQVPVVNSLLGGVTGTEFNEGMNPLTAQSGTVQPLSMSGCMTSSVVRSSIGAPCSESEGNIVLSSSHGSSQPTSMAESSGAYDVGSGGGYEVGSGGAYEVGNGGGYEVGSGGDGFVLDAEMQELLEQSSIVCLDV